MRVLCVIPARIGSSRLPNKPLQTVGGQALVSLVAERVFELGVCDDIVVATDHIDVCRAVLDLPVEGVLTSPEHRSGTERVAEVARNRAVRLIVNVQGDEPFVSRELLRGVIDSLRAGANLATAATELVEGDWEDPNVTKVSVSPTGHARDFARHGNRISRARGDWLGRHIGVYGYRRGALLRWVDAAPTVEEVELGLEQLRPLSYDETFTVTRVVDAGPPGIDTIEDLHEAERYMKAQAERVRV